MIGSHGQSTVMTSVVCKYVTTWQQNRNIRKIIFMIVSEDEIQYLGSFYRLMQEEASEISPIADGMKRRTEKRRQHS